MDSQGHLIPRQLLIHSLEDGKTGFETCDDHESGYRHCMELVPNVASFTAEEILKGVVHFVQVEKLKGTALRKKVDEVLEIILKDTSPQALTLQVKDRFEAYRFETALRMILAKDMRNDACVDYLVKVE